MGRDTAAKAGTDDNKIEIELMIARLHIPPRQHGSGFFVLTRTGKQCPERNARSSIEWAGWVAAWRPEYAQVRSSVATSPGKSDPPRSALEGVPSHCGRGSQRK